MKFQKEMEYYGLCLVTEILDVIYTAMSRFSEPPKL